ncbi:hypothetical protein CEUSTIGMA_g11051.t1 [Chlamydomonas eustigma]|uniref:Uncharacterized protein n=1 Tax=Chlamydomonas eustigma TaxID=1157962 RepID=A0A250XKP1_9CHLO|nr:hypothetical protein CEUSTIGMA_g11051.t1 [Chlamydomonas eustigma]|eukprot:GAX83627.1 hypothetical protein CEUSTIGMA_g11051.t1 [Chlamydomonas eustigma]
MRSCTSLAEVETCLLRFWKVLRSREARPARGDDGSTEMFVNETFIALYNIMTRSANLQQRTWRRSILTRDYLKRFGTPYLPASKQVPSFFRSPQYRVMLKQRSTTMSSLDCDQRLYQTGSPSSRPPYPVSSTSLRMRNYGPRVKLPEGLYNDSQDQRRSSVSSSTESTKSPSYDERNSGSAPHQSGSLRGSSAVGRNESLLRTELGKGHDPAEDLSVLRRVLPLLLQLGGPPTGDPGQAAHAVVVLGMAIQAGVAQEDWAAVPVDSNGRDYLPERRKGSLPIKRSQEGRRRGAFMEGSDSREEGSVQMTAGSERQLEGSSDRPSSSTDSGWKRKPASFSLAAVRDVADAHAAASVLQLFQFGPRYLSMLLLGLALLGLNPGPDWLNLATQAVLETLHKMTGKQAASVVHAYALFGFKPPEGIFQELVHQLQQKMDELLPSQQALLIQDLAKLGFVPQPAWQRAFVMKSVPKLSGLDSRRLAGIIDAMIAMRYVPPPWWLDTLYRSSLAVLHEAKREDVAALLYSLCRMGATPPPGWVHETLMQARGVRKWPPPPGPARPPSSSRAASYQSTGHDSTHAVQAAAEVGPGSRATTEGHSTTTMSGSPDVAVAVAEESNGPVRITPDSKSGGRTASMLNRPNQPTILESSSSSSPMSSNQSSYSADQEGRSLGTGASMMLPQQPQHKLSSLSASQSTASQSTVSPSAADDGSSHHLTPTTQDSSGGDRTQPSPVMLPGSSSSLPQQQELSALGAPSLVRLMYVIARLREDKRVAPHLPWATKQLQYLLKSQVTKPGKPTSKDHQKATAKSGPLSNASELQGLQTGALRRKQAAAISSQSVSAQPATASSSSSTGNKLSYSQQQDAVLHLSPQLLVDLLYIMAEFGYLPPHGPKAPIVHFLMDRLQNLLPGLSTNNMTTIMVCIAVLRLEVSVEWCAAFFSHFKASLRLFRPQELANVLTAADHLDLYPGDEVLRAVEGRLAGFSIVDLAMFVRKIDQAGGRPHKKSRTVSSAIEAQTDANEHSDADMGTVVWLPVLKKAAKRIFTSKA